MRMITYECTAAIYAHKKRDFVPSEFAKALLLLIRPKIPPPRWRSGTPFKKGEINILPPCVHIIDYPINSNATKKWIR